MNNYDNPPINPIQPVRAMDLRTVQVPDASWQVRAVIRHANHLPFLCGQGTINYCTAMSTDILDTPFGKRMLARHDMIENLYKEMEQQLPCEAMSEEMLAAMNTSLGFPVDGPHAKDRDYRPYCVRKGCEYMPRMMRVQQGFSCWSCRNLWDLTIQKP